MLPGFWAQALGKPQSEEGALTSAVRGPVQMPELLTRPPQMAILQGAAQLLVCGAVTAAQPAGSDAGALGSGNFPRPRSLQVGLEAEARQEGLELAPSSTNPVWEGRKGQDRFSGLNWRLKESKLNTHTHTHTHTHTQQDFLFLHKANKKGATS